MTAPESGPTAQAPASGGESNLTVLVAFAAIGLFAVGAGVSITHGVQELITPEPAENFIIAYVVLGVAFVLEGVSFLQASRQVKAAAARTDRDVWTHVMRTSDPTVRAVFLEDAAALVGIVIAAAGIAGHQLTGSSVPERAWAGERVRTRQCAGSFFDRHT